VAAAYAFSPTVLFDGAVWGQFDALVLLATLLVLIFAARLHSPATGVALAFLITLKPQAIIFAPLVVAYLWRWMGWRGAICALGIAAAGTLVICSPYLLPPHPEMLAFYHLFGLWVREMPQASPGGFNLWWFLGAAQRNYQAPYLGPLTLNVIGWGLFLATLLLVVQGIWKDRSSSQLFSGAAILAIAFFDLTTLQHERYLFPAPALLLVAALYNRKQVTFYIAASATTLINIVMVPILVSSPSTLGATVSTWRTTLAAHFAVPWGAVSLVAAAINIWLLVCLVTLYVRGPRHDPSVMQTVSEKGS
jgi:Gpi18-like mannosyltransferase